MDKDMTEPTELLRRKTGFAEPTPIPSNLPEKAKGTILSYAFHLKKNGKADDTIQTAIRRLTNLAQQCNIDNPEEVKAIIATTKWKNTTRNTIATIYTMFLKYINKTWERPKYTETTELPFIPTEQEIDSLINGASKTFATALQLIKETGARIGEATKLQWQHIDTERKIIYITAEKGCNSRNLPISNKLIAMLNSTPKINNKVFQTDKHNLRKTLEYLRQHQADKLNNPRLKNIHFHTFRHWKGTMEYHKTKDIVHVKTVLGHRNIESTMLYINLESALYLTDSDEWTSKTAKTPDEAMKLIDTGFTLADTIDGIHIYRKRK